MKKNIKQKDNKGKGNKDSVLSSGLPKDVSNFPLNSLIRTSEEIADMYVNPKFKTTKTMLEFANKQWLPADEVRKAIDEIIGSCLENNLSESYCGRHDCPYCSRIDKLKERLGLK